MNRTRLYEAIAGRISVRKYQDRRVEPELLEQLLAFVPERVAECDIRFVVVDGRTMRANLETSLARLFNPPMYLALVAEEAPHFMTESGYRGEQLVLAATALGLGTCWIGALFAEDKVRAMLGLSPPLRAVAVTPLGYASTGILDAAIGGIVRRGAGSHKRMALREFVFADTYGKPLDFATGEPAAWERIFTAVRAAPSWANYQPWRFVVRGAAVYAVAVPPREARGFKGSQRKADLDYALLDLGIAMSHLAVACEAERMPGRWELFDGDTSTIKAELRIPAQDRLLAVWK